MVKFREEFLRSHRTLTTHPAGIKERFSDALCHGIAALNDDHIGEMPRDIQRDFRDFMDKVTTVEGRPVGTVSIPVAISEMGEGKVQCLVDDFLELAERVRDTR